MELKGSKTEKNLWEAFAGESMARNKYTYFSSVADKEGYKQIAAIFTETADNEKAHAKVWFKLLDGIGTTAENLKAAACGETKNGPPCTQEWQKKPMKKVSRSLRNCFVRLPRWKRTMKNAIKS